QHAAWIFAVFVITPSRSNRTASYRSRLITHVPLGCRIDPAPVTKGHPSTERQSPNPGPPARHQQGRQRQKVTSVKRRSADRVKRCLPPSNEPRWIPLPDPISNP